MYKTAFFSDKPNDLLGGTNQDTFLSTNQLVFWVTNQISTNNETFLHGKPEDLFFEWHELIFPWLIIFVKGLSWTMCLRKPKNYVISHPEPYHQSPEDSKSTPPTAGPSYQDPLQVNVKVIPAPTAACTLWPLTSTTCSLPHSEYLQVETSTE